MPRFRVTCIIVALASAFSFAAEPEPAQKAAPTSAAAQGANARATYFGARPHPKSQLLLQYSAVQEELALSPSQRKKLAAIADQLARENRERREAVDKLASVTPDPEAQKRLYQEERRAAVLHVVDAEPMMLAVLDRRQRTRLDQIQLQAAGPAAVLLDGFAERLNLDPGQIERSKELVFSGLDGQFRLKSTAEERISGILNKAGKRRPAGQEKAPLQPGERKALNAVRQASDNDRVELRKAVDQKFLGILTKRQRATYQKMLGEPFIVGGSLIRKPSTDVPEPKARARGEDRDSAK